MNNKPTTTESTTDTKRKSGILKYFTPSFSALFLLEMWERFGYYGMQILIVVFLKEFLGFSDTHANLTWGAFAAMVYTTPIIGGWIGDRVLGTRRTTMLGAIVLAIGYLLLAVPGPIWLIFFAFGVIAAGNGLFKANPNNLLSQLYKDDESELDGAFTLYYMSINIGAFASQILTPIVRVHYGWHLAFGISVIGLILGISQFTFMKKHLSHVGSKPDFEPLSIIRLVAVVIGTFVVAVIIAFIVHNVRVAEYIVWTAAACLICLFLYVGAKGDKAERSGVIATGILTLQGILFFIFYMQMSTSLTLFAMRNVDLNFYGYHIPPEQFQVLNPFWIFILSPIIAYIYNKLDERDKDLNIGSKFSVGFLLLAIGFFIYGLSGHFTPGNIISPWWMVAGYFFQSSGELLISGLGLAMVSRFIAPRIRGVFMGGWLLATGISQFLGSMVANFASVPDTVGGVLKLVPASNRSDFLQLPNHLQQMLSQMDLGSFRYWLNGSPINPHALGEAPKRIQNSYQAFSPHIQHLLHQLPSASSLPLKTQQTLEQMNTIFFHNTIQLYTHLFLVLGIIAVAATIIAALLIPVIKRLSKTHAEGAIG